MNKILDSSFRDPSGFVFSKDGVIYRQVNQNYKDDYDFFLSSGLYKTLVEKKLLIPHEECLSLDYAQSQNAYKILKPEQIQFISYPYEWGFSQLKDAALITLKIQQIALKFGMTLKDSSMYNIQYFRGKPIFIDTLSFERYQDGKPWVAYRQFCQHFLAPLALMSYRNVSLNQLLKVYLDGIPLDLASSLLPLITRLKPSLLAHIHLHAKSQKRFADKVNVGIKEKKVSKIGVQAIIDNLTSVTKSLNWQPSGTEWTDYYQATNYTDKALQHKKEIVKNFILQTNSRIVWDLGANTGVFSRIASNEGIQTISFDIDPGAVEKNYLEAIEKEETKILPLLLDLTNPSPNIGWDNKERMSFFTRGPADAVFALALIHHLAISNNVPLIKIAEFFSRICKYLIIEFIPKQDSQVQKLLATRKDIFGNYTQQDFETALAKFFMIKDHVAVTNCERIIYLMENKKDTVVNQHFDIR